MCPPNLVLPQILDKIQTNVYQKSEITLWRGAHLISHGQMNPSLPGGISVFSFRITYGLSDPASGITKTGENSMKGKIGMQALPVLPALLLVSAMEFKPKTSCGSKESSNVPEKITTEITGAEKKKNINMILKSDTFVKTQKELKEKGFTQKDSKTYTILVTLKDNSLIEILAISIQFKSSKGEVQQLSYAYNPETGRSIVMPGHVRNVLQL